MSSSTARFNFADCSSNDQCSAPLRCDTVQKKCVWKNPSESGGREYFADQFVQPRLSASLSSDFGDRKLMPNQSPYIASARFEPGVFYEIISHGLEGAATKRHDLSMFLPEKYHGPTSIPPQLVINMPRDLYQWLESRADLSPYNRAFFNNILNYLNATQNAGATNTQYCDPSTGICSLPISNVNEISDEESREEIEEMQRQQQIANRIQSLTQPGQLAYNASQIEHKQYEPLSQEEEQSEEEEEEYLPVGRRLRKIKRPNPFNNDNGETPPISPVRPSQNVNVIQQQQQQQYPPAPSSPIQSPPTISRNRRRQKVNEGQTIDPLFNLYSQLEQQRKQGELDWPSFYNQVMRTFTQQWPSNIPINYSILSNLIALMSRLFLESYPDPPYLELKRLVLRFQNRFGNAVSPEINAYAQEWENRLQNSNAFQDLMALAEAYPNNSALIQQILYPYSSPNFDPNRSFLLRDFVRKLNLINAIPSNLAQTVLNSVPPPISA